MIGGCTLGELFADHGDLVDLRSADLVGTWRSGTTRSIVFEENGEFSATDLPYAVFDHVLEDRGYVARIDGSGTWTSQRAGTGPDDPQALVSLLFRRLGDMDVAHAGPDLTALRQDNGAVLLFFFYVDVGNSWTSYAKCVSDCPQ